MNSQPSSRWSSQKIFWLVVIGIGFLLLSYSSYRAYTTSFTYDESSTVLEFVPRNYVDIFLHAPTANNHVLNTALIKLFASIFPGSELVYRLPNLLAHLVFLVFSMLLVSRVSTNQPFKILAFLLLNFNPYMLDFFSLARGYGLALGFTMVALYFCVLFFESHSKKYMVACLVACALAVLSNFSLLNLFLGLSSLFLVSSLGMSILTRKTKPFLITTTIVTLVSVVLFALIQSPIKELIEKKELFFGGKIGLWQDTIQSLINKTAYLLHAPTSPVYLAIFLGMCLCILICLGYSLLFTGRKKPSIAKYLLLLLIIVLAGIQAQHVLFGTLFIIERTALFLIPLFNVLLIISISEATRSNKWIGNLTLSVVAVLMVGNSVSKMNSTHSLDWNHERNMKQTMADISEFKQPYEVYFGVNWPYSVTAKFYRELYGYTWLRVIEINESEQTTHLPFDLELAKRKSIKSKNVIQLLDDNALGVYHPKSHTIQNVNHLLSDTVYTITGEEYIDLLRDSISNLLDSNSLLNLSVRLNIQANASNAKDLKLVLATESDILRFEKVATSCMGTDSFSLSIYYRDHVDSQGKRITAYLWNPKRESFQISDLEIKSISIE